MESSNKKIVLRVVVCFVLAVGLLLGGYFVWQSWSNRARLGQRPVSYIHKAEALNASSVVNDADTVKIISDYGQDYMTARAQVIMKAPKEWTADTVDKAYFLLAYMVKVEEYRDVGVVLDMLDQAKAAGIAVDRPGADQAYRDSLRSTYNDAMSHPDLRPTAARRD